MIIWCGSKEVYIEAVPVRASLESFERGLKETDIGYSPNIIYAYVVLNEGVPFANGAPHLTVDIPALQELSNYASAGGLDRI